MKMKNIFRGNGDSKAATAEVVRLREDYYAALKRKLNAVNAGDADAVVEADARLRVAKIRISVAEKAQRQAKRDEIERLRDEVPGRRENLRRTLETTITDAVMHLEIGCRGLHAVGLGSVEEDIKRAIAISGEIPAVALGNGQAAADAYLVEHPLPDIAAQREGLHGIESVLDGSPWAVEGLAKRDVIRALREKLTDNELAERADLERWARRR